MTPLWIDTDMGFDDMLAILMVQRSGRPVAGCSLVFGCAELAQVCRNAEAMAATFGWQFPMHSGAASPIVGETETAARILGPTGLQTLGRDFVEMETPAVRQSAFPALTQWLEHSQETVEVLALGPADQSGRPETGPSRPLRQDRPHHLDGRCRVTWQPHARGGIQRLC